MLKERIDSIIEELDEVQTPAELGAIVEHWARECREVAEHKVCMDAVTDAVERLSRNPQPQVTAIATMDVVRAEQVHQDIKLTPVQRTVRKYKLLKREADWSTKPQVHAIMDIVCAHMDVGDVVEETEIVRMLVANESRLNTRQGALKIWNYYKGTHNEGLVAHGNFERI